MTDQELEQFKDLFNKHYSSFYVEKDPENIVYRSWIGQKSCKESLNNEDDFKYKTGFMVKNMIKSYQLQFGIGNNYKINWHIKYSLDHKAIEIKIQKSND